MKRCYLIFVFGLCAADEADALVQPIPLEELVRSADVIVVGRVVQISSDWANGHRIIVSSAVINPEMVIKGAINIRSPLIVQYRGGAVDGIEMKVSEAVCLSEGEQALLFLKRSRDGKYHVCGRFQGKYSIMIDKNRRNIVISPLFSEGYDMREYGFGARDGRLPLFDFIFRICRFI